MVAATEPQCKTNLSSEDHSVDVFDSISVDCNVRYRGRWAPVITCEPGDPGTINIINSRVTYKQVIPASPQLHGRTILCTTVFTSPAPSFSSADDVHPYDSYTWTSPTIRVVSNKILSGKCAAYNSVPI